jgi:hypothetical protein
MSDFQAIADRVEIEALRGEYTDAVMSDYDRVALLFTPDGALRMPNVPVDLVGLEKIRAWGDRVPAFVDYLVQTTHPGAHPPARRQLAAELRHLPRPLPAHRGRLEVHRARLRDQIPRPQPAGGLGTRRRRKRPLTRRREQVRTVHLWACTSSGCRS